MSLILVLSCLTFGRNQGGWALKLDLEDPRPMAKALQLLAQKTGWRITYEDLPLIHSSDYVDKTDFKAAQKTAARILLPIGGRINTVLVIPSDLSKTNALQLINNLIDNYVAMGNTGMFAIRESPGAFHVIPVMAKNANGKSVNVVPLLDARISFPQKERTAHETLLEFCGALQRARGTRVLLMNSPMKLLTNRREKVEATNEMAREVLLRLLDSTGVRLTWHLYWDPGLLAFGLNIDVVMVEELTPTGKVRLRPVPS